MPCPSPGPTVLAQGLSMYMYVYMASSIKASARQRVVRLLHEDSEACPVRTSARSAASHDVLCVDYCHLLLTYFALSCKVLQAYGALGPPSHVVQCCLHEARDVCPFGRPSAGTSSGKQRRADSCCKTEDTRHTPQPCVPDGQKFDVKEHTTPYCS